MADEGKLRQQEAKGNRAKQERQSPLMDGFFRQAKDVCHRIWQETAPDQHEIREKAWQRLQALEDIEVCFHTTIADGKVASAELARLTKEQNE